MTKKLVIFTLLVFVCTLGIFAQESNKKPGKKIQIVLLGTFHFGATSDKNKTEFDALAASRQAEINRVVEALAKYNPDKIFVEHEPDQQAKWDKIYADYKQGIEPKGNDLRNEIFQIGVKLAKKTNNPNGVICVDYQMPTDYDDALKNAQTEVEKTYIKQVQAIAAAPEPKMSNQKFFNLPFQKSASFKALKLTESNLLDYYLYLNSPEYIALNHYNNDNYLALGLGENKDYTGAEYVNLWYNRNLKILTNILRNSSLEDNRYLLIIGSAHVKVLQDFFRDHPYFEVVSFENAIGGKQTEKTVSKAK